MSPSSSRSLSWAASSDPPTAPRFSSSSNDSSASVTSTSCWLTTGPPTVLCLFKVRGGRHRLPDRLLLACRTGCCRTTLAAGTSSWGSGSGFGRPNRSSPRFSAPFCPVSARDAVFAGRGAVPVRAVPVRAVPVRAEPDAVPLLALAGADPCAAGRPVAEPLRAPLAAVLAPEAVLAPAPEAVLAPEAGRAEAGRDEPDPDEAGRAGFGATRAEPPAVAPPSAPSAPTGRGSQFLNMMYCWPSVHRLVVTQ